VVLTPVPETETRGQFIFSCCRSPTRRIPALDLARKSVKSGARCAIRVLVGSCELLVAGYMGKLCLLEYPHNLSWTGQIATMYQSSLAEMNPPVLT
jgi:hypothetical protein